MHVLVMAGTSRTDVVDGVDDDVVDVVVGDGVHHLAAAPLSGEQLGGAQHPEVLGHEGLALARGLHQFVDTAWSLGQLEEDGHPKGVGHRLEQLGAAFEHRSVSHTYIVA